ncbi:hypothetical protein [Salmonella enterica]|uniref:hypothetical protein n=1 Tax=Salmonella enterica TaxID=28901 RepID=UPI003D3130A8
MLYIRKGDITRFSGDVIVNAASDRAARIALRTIITFLTNIAPDLDVYCFCFDRRDTLIYRRILEEHYPHFLTDDAW